VDEGNVIATAELTPITAPFIDVHDSGLDFDNHIHTRRKTKTVEFLFKCEKDRVCEKTTPTGRAAGRTTAKNSLNVIQQHRSDIDHRQAIDEMLNNAGRRRKTRILVQDKPIVRESSDAISDDIAITYVCDVIQPPLPPPVVPPNSPTTRVEPVEPLSVSGQVDAEMLEVSPALDERITPGMRVFACVSSESTQGVEPHEPLSANAQGVAEMFIALLAFQMSRNTITTPQNRVEPFEPLSRIGQAVRKCSKCPLRSTVHALPRRARSRPHHQR
jgi:hypothetical protein